MKNRTTFILSLFFLGFFVLPSCKRNWTCQCENDDKAVIHEDVIDMTRKEAKEYCEVKMDFVADSLGFDCRLL